MSRCAAPHAPSVPGRNRGPGSAAPCSASTAGRTNSSNPTSDDTGFPGSPNTSVAPRTPKETGLPGRTATRQNTSSTPRSASIRRTRSCGPTDTPPEVSEQIGGQAPLERGAMGVLVVRRDRAGARPPPRPPGAAPRASLRSPRRSRRARAARPADGSSVPVAITDRPRPTRADDVRDPGRGERSDLRRARAVRRQPRRHRRRGRRRRAGARWRRARTAGTVTSFPATVTCSIGHDGVRSVGHDAAGRDRHRLARTQRAGRRPTGRDALTDGQRRRRVRPRGARSRPSPSWRTAAGRPPRGPARRARGRRRPRSPPTRTDSGRTRSSTRASASSIVSSSATRT